jgi:hypothetical protein
MPSDVLAAKCPSTLCSSSKSVSGISLESNIRSLMDARLALGLGSLLVRVNS